MWVFTTSGFFSAVRHREHPDQVCVRARFKGDLEEAFPRARVVHTPRADYAYRVVVRLREWEKFLRREARRVLDYDNFKGAVRDPHRHRAYGRVWEVMVRAQVEAAARARDSHVRTG